MLPQIIDLRAEGETLRALLATRPAADFELTTAFKGWTVADVLRHLHVGDSMARASITDAAGFQQLLTDVRAKRAIGLSPRDDARARLEMLSGPPLLARWWAGLDDLCTLLAAQPHDTRLKWAGPDMGLRMFTTARQMEVWAHGQEIYDRLGLDRAPTDRLRNIVEIGVRTFGWTFANRGLPAPGAPPHVSLTGPTGDRWDWNPPSADNCVEGTALAFCQVVTQVRNIADTRLTMTGDTARQWMAIAQCFAGPPEPPPAPGTRARTTREDPDH